VIFGICIDNSKANLSGCSLSFSLYSIAFKRISPHPPSNRTILSPSFLQSQFALLTPLA